MWLYLHSMRLLKLPNLLDLIHQVSSIDVLHHKIQSILEDRDGEAWGKCEFFLKLLIWVGEARCTTMVWKQECSCVRKGGFPARASTLFSTMVHSTSSSWITTSFFRILMAYSSSVPFLSASITWKVSTRVPVGVSAHWFVNWSLKMARLTLPKLPFPKTMIKLKSESLTRSWLPLLSYLHTEEEEEEESVGFPGPTLARWIEKKRSKFVTTNP